MKLNQQSTPELRHTVLIYLAFTLVAVFGFTSTIAMAGENLPVKNEITNLMLCYAAGTDAIGDSTRADPQGDGEAIYAECFTDSAVFRAWFPGTDFNDPSQAVVVGPGGGLTGPEAWAGFVFSVFNGTYTFTQHMLSNFIVHTDGNSGQLEAYLNASHVTQDAGVVTQVEVANGTYTLTVEKIGNKWKVTQLDLKLINFVPVYAAP